MNIAFLIPDLAQGGAQKQCIKLAKALETYCNFKITLITFRNTGEQEYLLDSWFVNRFNLGNSSGFNPKLIWDVRKTLIDQDIDILVTWLHSADVIGYFATLNLKCKWILNERDSQYPVKLRYLFRRIVGLFANLILANSTKGLEYWSYTFGNIQKQRVYNIVDVNQQYCKNPKMIDIIYVGRLEKQKNFLKVIGVMKEIARLRSDINLIIVGNGSLFEPGRRAAIREISEGTIHFLGYRNDAEELISNSRMLINLSSHEGSPNTVLEALVLNTIPILSYIPEHVELVGQEYPLLFALNDPVDKIAKVVLEKLPEYNPQKISIDTASLVSRNRPEVAAKDFLKICSNLMGV